MIRVQLTMTYGAIRDEMMDLFYTSQFSITAKAFEASLLAEGIQAADWEAQMVKSGVPPYPLDVRIVVGTKTFATDAELILFKLANSDRFIIEVVE